MGEKTLVLSDQDGQVVRTFHWNQTNGRVVRRFDTKRVEVVPNLDKLTADKVQFEDLGEISKDILSQKSFLVGKIGHLKLVEKVENTLQDQKEEKEDNRKWYAILVAVFLLIGGFLGVVFKHEPRTEGIEAELKQELVKIVKAIPPKQKTDFPKVMNQQPTETEKVAPTKTATSLKRMGALAALGSLSKGKQKGGIDLGAVNTTAGPGLGGTQGSGGVQTSLYGKGIVSAPLGAGNNVQGAGGYGTQGKGGGQAGYGKLSLIGSTGASAVPLVQEASAESGLDMDAIAAVIARNSGQVRFCYEQGLQGDPNLSGRVAVNFTIGGNGVVTAAAIGNSTLASKIVEDCIMLRLRSWKFPLPQGGVDVKVSYPFNLRRAGHG
jgi:hypothetical protein